MVFVVSNVKTRAYQTTLVWVALTLVLLWGTQAFIASSGGPVWYLMSPEVTLNEYERETGKVYVPVHDAQTKLFLIVTHLSRKKIAIYSGRMEFITVSLCMHVQMNVGE